MLEKLNTAKEKSFVMNLTCSRLKHFIMNNAFICFVGFILRIMDFISNTSGLIESFRVNRKKCGPVFLQSLKVLQLAKRWSHLLSTVTLGSNFVPVQLVVYFQQLTLKSVLQMFLTGL